MYKILITSWKVSTTEQGCAIHTTVLEFDIKAQADIAWDHLNSEIKSHPQFGQCCQRLY